MSRIILPCIRIRWSDIPKVKAWPSICAGLEGLDGRGRFREDTWQREGGGGGRSRVMTEGRVFEKAGVGFSEVFGPVEGELERVLAGDGPTFYATGVSLVLHPRPPRVPPVHPHFPHLGRRRPRLFRGRPRPSPYYPPDGGRAPSYPPQPPTQRSR